MSAKSLVYEIPVDSVESAIIAQEAGAHRVELCANLIEGGTTPSPGMIRQVRANISIGLNVMIRPRGGDFLYSEHELAVMRDDIAFAKELGADGLVFGMLRADGTVDAVRCAELIALAHPLPVTFHRAIDMTRDPFEALKTLIRLGIPRVLSSGHEASVMEGLETLIEMVRLAGDRIIVMPGGGVTERNIGRIVAQTGVYEIHFSGRSPVESGMQYRQSGVYMGGTFRPPEFSQQRADPEKLRKFITAAQDSRSNLP